MWEVEAWAKGWLERSKENPLKACCKLCNKDWVPEKSELQKHTKTADHKYFFKEIINPWLQLWEISFLNI